MKLSTTVTITFFTLLISALSATHQVLGQTTDTPLAASLLAAQQQYTRTFAVHPQLYNGPEYIDYAKRYKVQNGHQFFLSPDKQEGNIYYNDHAFTGLQLQYDIVLEQLMLQHSSSPLTFRLINENVRNFTIDGHRFVRLMADSTKSPLIQTGYYEVLVDSTVQLLAKRVKQMSEKIEQGVIEVEFLPADKLFIRKADGYYAISKKRSVTQLFADHGKEVQKYIQDHKLRFKKASREADIVQLTRYYAGLRAR